MFLHGWSPLAYGTIRYFAATLLFVGFTYYRERSFRIERSDFWLVGLAAALIFLNQVCFVYGLKFAHASTMALLLGTTPVFIGLTTLALGLEHLARPFWIGAGVTFVGVALIAAGSGGGFSTGAKGDLIAICTALTWGVLHGHDRAADAPVLAVPDQRARPCARLDPAGARQHSAAARAGLLLRLEGVARLRLRRDRAAVPDEHPLVHGDRPGRPVARLAVREHAAVLRGRLRADPALGVAARRSRSSAACSSSPGSPSSGDWRHQREPIGARQAA